MKLSVPFLDALHYQQPLTEVAREVNVLPRNKIANVPWQEYRYCPQVSFVMARGGDCILLKYWVSEKAIRANYVNSNDPVFKDSCVEFFISVGDEETYYNLETNCIGTCLMGYGTGRIGRVLLDPDLIKRIRIQTTITRSVNDTSPDIQWEVMLVIPLNVFCYHTFRSLTGQHCKGNFYKCGDDLADPHFLSWNNINSPAPDFHLRGYFGDIAFL